MSATEIQSHIRELRRERLGADPVHADELAEELSVLEDVLVGVVVTEIALLRADLSGPLAG